MWTDTCYATYVHRPPFIPIVLPDLLLRRLRGQGRLCIYELMAEDSAVNYWEVCLFLSSQPIQDSD